MGSRLYFDRGATVPAGENPASCIICLIIDRGITYYSPAIQA
jgi:hypothetical protein